MAPSSAINATLYEKLSRDMPALLDARPEVSSALPEVPTVTEFVPGYEASTWYGIGAPKDTATEIIDKLNKEINAGLADSKMKAHVTREPNLYRIAKAETVRLEVDLHAAGLARLALKGP